MKNVGMTPPLPAAPLETPYYAVIFASARTPGDNGYAKRAEEMAELAAAQPGFLGIDSVRDAEGYGITVSYWRDEQSIAAWREHAAHTATRAEGREHWYESYSLHVAKVERAYGFSRPVTWD
jgi:heme-degrading monooxygenase HmoA